MILVFSFYCHDPEFGEAFLGCVQLLHSQSWVFFTSVGWFGSLCSFGPFPRILPLHFHCLLGSFTTSSIGRDLGTCVPAGFPAGFHLQEHLSPSWVPPAGAPAWFSCTSVLLGSGSEATSASAGFVLHFDGLVSPAHIGHDEQAREL